MKRMALLTTVVILLMGCGDGTGPGDQPRMSLSFSTGSTDFTSLQQVPAVSFSQSGVAGAPITDGQNELILSSVEVVLREIELKRIETFECDSLSDDDGCEEFEAGPLLVALPLDGSTMQAITIAIEPGTYDELEFDVHKLDDGDPRDADLLATDPELSDVSIRVEGTFNGEAFRFTTDVNEEQEFDLSPPLVVEEGATLRNVTVRLDVSAWFRDATGTLVDPATANKGGENENLVKDNIKDSIDAFDDDDRDGEDDD